ncbi:hypothetical protein Ga0466249_004814 [Sporomusaceae bacterium BoRhaA]|uniref:hypothetical protein n=1 Tax=Pelorhabdus rhamnosifermentans TaxID=2772457 RepID=UPI001C061FB2|nr:hypothetical protein [Pelorhabdus rhamnosifermentans]MBU2703666.1 hypothetical protein [Pelorhabdus rhamnosifermentans]
MYSQIAIDVATDRAKTLHWGWFGYKKENGHDVASCGDKRRCKNNHRKCECWEEADVCERPMTCREKADYRLWCEFVLHGWEKKPDKLRTRRIRRIFETEYRKTSKICKGCTECFCMVNEVMNPDCKQVKAV